MESQKTGPREGLAPLNAPQGQGLKRRRYSSEDTTGGVRPAPFTQGSVAPSSTETASIPPKMASRPTSAVASPAVRVSASPVPRLTTATPPITLPTATIVPGLASGDVMNNDGTENSVQMTVWEDIKRYLSPRVIGSLESLQLPDKRGWRSGKGIYACARFSYQILLRL